LLLGSARPANADLALTQAGLDQQFKLTTFATGFPSIYDIGPLGIVFPAGGGVLVSDYPGNVRLFPNSSDGQVAGPVVQNYGFGNAVGLAQVGNAIYMAQQTRGAVVQLNPDGTWKQDVVTGLPLATGIVANPANGHLIVSTASVVNKVFDVNPTAGTGTPIINAELDGLTITRDGSKLYAASENGHLVGYDLANGAKQMFDSGFIPGQIDGAVLGTGSLAGNIFVNTNDGTVVEVNLATGLQSLIAAGGSRGDFVMVDPTNDSLLLTQTDRIVRLTPPPGGGFGGNAPGPADPTVPEPSTAALLVLGGGALAGWRRWRGRRSHSTPAA
jgi:hypothetical protein